MESLGANRQDQIILGAALGDQTFRLFEAIAMSYCTRTTPLVLIVLEKTTSMVFVSCMSK